MLQILKTIDDALQPLENLEEGAWINLINPTESELSQIVDQFPMVDPINLKAALDEEERARIEIDDVYTLILVDVPVVEQSATSSYFSTIPLGILLFKDNIITVCTREVPLLKDFLTGRVKSFYTWKKTRFILQMLHRNATYYLQYLKGIDRASNRIERQLHQSTKNKELIKLLELQKSLVYFSTSLRSNEVVMDRMMRLDVIKKYPDDQELLEDVIIENKQAIEMTNIYSNILSGTMGAFASVISNNLNIVMKVLTSLTIVLAIPTMISSFFGMNVALPMEREPYAFLYILLMAVLLSAISGIVMYKKKMF